MGPSLSAWLFMQRKFQHLLFRLHESTTDTVLSSIAHADDASRSTFLLTFSQALVYVHRYERLRIRLHIFWAVTAAGDGLGAKNRAGLPISPVLVPWTVDRRYCLTRRRRTRVRMYRERHCQCGFWNMIHVTYRLGGWELGCACIENDIANVDSGTCYTLHIADAGLRGCATYDPLNHLKNEGYKIGWRPVESRNCMREKS